MKVSELLEGRGWAADMARENRERHRKEREAAKAEEKARAAAERERNKPAKKPSLDEIHSKVMNAVSDTFPDGEPLDPIRKWMDRNDIDLNDIDKAFKKFEKKDFYGYLAVMWDDFADDA